MIYLRNSFGNPVALDPLPGRGRWRIERDLAVFVGAATGRHMNHVITCSSRGQAEKIYAAAEAMLK